MIAKRFHLFPAPDCRSGRQIGISVMVDTGDDDIDSGRYC